MSEIEADGFCPRCGALEDQACQRPDGSPVPDHKARHPYPLATADPSPAAAGGGSE